MEQLAVEWLFEQIVNSDWRNVIGEEKIKIFEQAKKMQKEESKKIWDSAQYDMRKQFRSSKYRGMTFEEWFEQSSKIDNV